MDIKDLKPGLYLATTHERLEGMIKLRDRITFDIIVCISGDAPFLRMSGWNHHKGVLLTHEQCVGLSFEGRIKPYQE